MAIGTEIKCDVEGCGVVKKETNHWFLVTCVRGLIMARRFTLNGATGLSKIACGKAHALVLIDRMLEEINGK